MKYQEAINVAISIVMDTSTVCHLYLYCDKVEAKGQQCTVCIETIIKVQRVVHQLTSHHDSEY